MGASDQDGTLRVYWPDDLYVVGCRDALISLRDALNQALLTGHGQGLGPVVDGEARAVQVIRFEPVESRRSPHLPFPQPMRLPHRVPPRVERPQSMREPVLAGVLPEYG